MSHFGRAFILIEHFAGEYTSDTKIGALIWEARAKSKKNFIGLMQDGKFLDAHATVQSLDSTIPLEFVESV